MEETNGRARRFAADETMLGADRRKLIRELLLEYTHVDVSSLCTFLHVSPATVRRDLDALEQEGFLIKTYGGAVLNEGGEEGAYLKNAADPYELERKTIAAFAVNLIEDGDVVFLGSGTVCTHMARQLRMRGRLSVVTCSLSVALELAGATGVNTMLVGGSLSGAGRDAETCGESARSTLSRMYFNRCFLPFDGVSLKRGYTVDSTDKAGLLRAVLENSDVSYALADAGNLDRTSLCPVAPLDAIGRVIGPISMPASYKEYFLNHGICLYDVTQD